MNFEQGYGHKETLFFFFFFLKLAVKEVQKWLRLKDNFQSVGKIYFSGRLW